MSAVSGAVFVISLSLSLKILMHSVSTGILRQYFLNEEKQVKCSSVDVYDSFKMTISSGSDFSSTNSLLSLHI